MTATNRREAHDDALKAINRYTNAQAALIETVDEVLRGAPRRMPKPEQERSQTEIQEVRNAWAQLWRDDRKSELLKDSGFSEEFTPEVLTKLVHLVHAQQVKLEENIREQDAAVRSPIAAPSTPQGGQRSWYSGVKWWQWILVLIGVGMLIVVMTGAAALMSLDPPEYQPYRAHSQEAR